MSTMEDESYPTAEIKHANSMLHVAGVGLPGASQGKRDITACAYICHIPAIAKMT